MIDGVTLTFGVKNTGTKPIAGVSGTITVTDMFNKQMGYGSINPFLKTEETHREPTISEPVKTTILSMTLRAHLVRATIYQESTGKILKVLTLNPH